MENFQKNFITSDYGAIPCPERCAARGNSWPSGKKLIRCSLVHERQIMDEIVLLHRSTGNYYSLNDTGAAIWKYCAQGRRWEEILDFVSREYQMEKTTLDEEIGFYLQELVREGIFEVR